jgi:ribosome-binding protein aMBF1 (putative translation factor)
MKQLNIDFIRSDLAKDVDAITFIERCLCDARISRAKLSHSMNKHRQEINLIFNYRVKLSHAMFTSIAKTLNIELLLKDEKYVTMLIDRCNEKYIGMKG